MRRIGFHRFAPLLPVLMLGGCAMHSTATRWNGHVGADGEPVFAQTSTYVGVHLFGVVPMIGKTTIDEMVEDSTGLIPAAKGRRLRLVETESNNYWYGVPPLSWFFSPVVTSVTFEYQPSASALAEVGIEPEESAAVRRASDPANPPR